MRNLQPFRATTSSTHTAVDGKVRAGSTITRSLRGILDRYSADSWLLFRFCVVGASGALIDTLVMFLLADPAQLNWDVHTSKLLAAEAAICSNFVWNDTWTFRQPSKIQRSGTLSALFRRFVTFHMICGLGVGIALLSLDFLYLRCGWPLLSANAVSILLATIWNYSLNKKLNWNERPTQEGKPLDS